MDADLARKRLVMKAPNEPVLLREGQFTIRRGDNEYMGDGAVRLEWLPHPEVHLRMEYETVHFGETDPDEAIVTLPKKEATLPLGFVSVGAVFGSEGTYTKSVSAYVKPLSLGEGTLEEVQFGIVNLPRFLWTHDTPDDLGQGEMLLDSERWTVEIAPVGDHEFMSSLKDANGFAITHQGTLRSKSGGFSTAEAVDHLRCLHYFFAFSRGAWCPPILAVGIDWRGAVVWEDWTVWLMDTARWRETWLDSSYPQGMHYLYPGFLALWETSWQLTLVRLIHMYVEANAHTSVDTSIVLSFVALELLMWSVSRPDPSMRTTKDISEALKWLKVRDEIPAATPALHDYARSLFRKNAERRKASAMLQEIRNGIVHPTRSRDAPSDAVLDARSLALHWFELAMLRLMNYRGEYVDRLKRHHVFGQRSKVPWFSAAVYLTNN